MSNSTSPSRLKFSLLEGRQAYKSRLLTILFRSLTFPLSLDPPSDICHSTAMTAEDVFYVLREQDMITVSDGQSGKIRAPATSKYKSRDGGVSSSNRGRRGRPRGGTAANRAAVAHKDKESALSIPSEYSIHFDRAYVIAHLKNYENKNYLKVRPEKLKWTPFLIARALPQTIEDGNNVDSEEIILAKNIRRAAQEALQRNLIESEIERDERKLREENNINRFAELPSQEESHHQQRNENGKENSTMLLHEEGQPDVLVPANNNDNDSYLFNVQATEGAPSSTAAALAALKVSEEDSVAVDDALGIALDDDEKDGDYDDDVDAEGEIDDDVDAEGEIDEDF